MYNGAMLTNIDIDNTLAQEAMALTGARSKRELVDRALREMLQRAKRPSILGLYGAGGIAPDYDPKAPFGVADAQHDNRVEIA
jgi:Arc/MetJ family transcription regulator